MKLLYLSGAPTVSTHSKATSGGPRSHVLGIISAFRVKGWTVTEFIFGNQFNTRLRGTNPSLKLKGNFFLRLASDLFRIWVGLINQRKVALRYRGFDLCYERFAAFQSLGALLKRRTGTVWLLETNGPYFLEAKQDRKSVVLSGVCKWLEHRAYHGCDHLIVISEELKIILLEHFGLPKKKIIVLPNGVDTNRFKPSGSAPTSSRNTFTIGFVGALIKWCGLYTLFEAVALLKSELSVSLTVTIVGDGIEMQAFKEKCSQLKLQDTVVFLGNRPWEEIPHLIEGFDLCFSGQVETTSGRMYHSPLKIYEYLAMGKPVVASAFQDAKNTIEEGYNGFLFKAGDVTGLKEKLMAAFRRSGAAGFDHKGIRQRILDHHSWDSRVDFLLKELSNAND